MNEGASASGCGRTGMRYEKEMQIAEGIGNGMEWGRKGRGAPVAIGLSPFSRSLNKRCPLVTSECVGRSVGMRICQPSSYPFSFPASERNAPISSGGASAEVVSTRTELGKRTTQ